MIVAQQFIAGGRLKRRVRPGRDDRSTVCAREVALEAKGNGSFVPPGRTPLLGHFPALRTGLLLSGSPSGTTLLGAYPTSCVDANARPAGYQIRDLRKSTRLQ
jgi:hypothetical protein